MIDSRKLSSILYVFLSLRFPPRDSINLAPFTCALYCFQFDDNAAILFYRSPSLRLSPQKQSLRFPRERVTRLSRYVLVRKPISPVYKSENFDDYREEEKDQPPTRHLINFHFVPFAFYIHAMPIFASGRIDSPKVETRINIGGKICEARYDSKGEKKTIFLRRWKKKISRVDLFFLLFLIIFHIRLITRYRGYTQYFIYAR